MGSWEGALDPDQVPLVPAARSDRHGTRLPGTPDIGQSGQQANASRPLFELRQFDFNMRNQPVAVVLMSPPGVTEDFEHQAVLGQDVGDEST